MSSTQQTCNRLVIATIEAKTNRVHVLDRCFQERKRKLLHPDDTVSILRTATRVLTALQLVEQIEEFGQVHHVAFAGCDELIAEDNVLIWRVFVLTTVELGLHAPHLKEITFSDKVNHHARERLLWKFRQAIDDFFKKQFAA